MRKYSTERARANELGGTMHTSPSNSTNDLGSNGFGSTIESGTLVKIRNSRATRMS
jgi:pantoate kinase